MTPPASAVTTHDTLHAPMPRAAVAGMVGVRAHAAARPTVRALMLIVVVAVVPYLNALQADFTFDDHPHIRNNPVVTDGLDVWRVLATPLPPGDLYRPLTVWTYALNEYWAPGEAVGFHAVNLALHALVTVLVFLLAQQLFASATIAAIAAMLFAVHPVHTEAVTNIVGRAELLAALFGLLALVSAGWAQTARSAAKRRTFDGVSLVAFVLAIASKESALTLLLLIPLVRITQRSEPLRLGLWHEVRTLNWVPYTVCAVGFLLLRLHVVWTLPAYSLTPLDNVLAFVPWHVRIASALGVMWDYFGLLNLPIVLASDYSYPQVPIVSQWAEARFLGGVVLIAAAGTVAWRCQRPPVCFAILFPLIAVLLTANLLFAIGTIKAERLLYLPSVGWTLLVAFVIGTLLDSPRYRTPTTVCLAVVVAGYAARTWTRNWDWQDNQTVFHAMARTAPDSAKSRYNNGVAYQRENDDDAAVAEFERALQLYPWSEGSAFGIGLAFDRKGVPDKALEWYRKALEIDPAYAKAHNNLCRLYLLQGRFAEAEAACRTGLRHEPTDASFMKGLAESLVGGAQTERGLTALRRAITLNPEDASWRARLEELERATPVCGLPPPPIPLAR